jgi:hypothetical protein
MIVLRRAFFLLAMGSCLPAGLSPVSARPSLFSIVTSSGNQAAEEQIEWRDVRAWGVEGRILPEQERLGWFDRLPASAQGKVPEAVWNLSHDSAGMLVRFRTDSPEIQVRYRLRRGELAMSHMPATGVSGVDLYARDEAGKWRWVGVTRPGGKEVASQLTSGLPVKDREYALYLPLYNGVESLELGVLKGAAFEGLPPRERPIVFYGTSITQGACASRPGMVHTAILGRRLDRPIINLGFSGAGRMDSEVGDYLAQLDASLFVIDCLPNMKPELVAERCVPLVKQLRASRPDAPIVLVEDRLFTNSWISPERQTFHARNQAALKAAFEQLQREGVTGLYYVQGALLYGEDSEGATDGSHANDLGFMRQADAFEPVLRAALQSAK